MGEGRPTVKWVCDRCGAVIVTISSEQPDEWFGVIPVNPPRADAYDGKRLVLCHDCYWGFVGYLRAGGAYREDTA